MQATSEKKHVLQENKSNKDASVESGKSLKNEIEAKTCSFRLWYTKKDKEKNYI